MKFRNYDKYEVYDDGRIYSYWTNKFLKPNTLQSGYQQVNLYDNEGKRKMYYLHRVVYEAITGKPIPEGYEINHKDECKTSNIITNLELVSHKENINYGSRNERAGKAISKSNTNNTKLSKALTNNPKRSKAMTNNPKISKQVGAFKDGKLVMSFPSTAECGRQGFNQQNVSACCRKCHNRLGNNVYKGYTWKYI